MPYNPEIDNFHDNYLSFVNSESFDHLACIDAADSLIDRRVDLFKYADWVIERLPEDSTTLTEQQSLQIGIALEAIRDEANYAIQWYRRNGSIPDADSITVDTLTPFSDKENTLENYFIDSMDSSTLSSTYGLQTFLSIVAYSGNLDRAEAAWERALEIGLSPEVERIPLHLKLAEHVVGGL